MVAKQKGTQVADESETEPLVTPSDPRDGVAAATTTTAAASKGGEQGQGLNLVGAGIATRGTQADGALRPLEGMCAERIVLAPVDDSEHSGASLPIQPILLLSAFLSTSPIF